MEEIEAKLREILEDWAEDDGPAGDDIPKLIQALRVACEAIDRHHLVWNNQNGTCSSECSRLCQCAKKIKECLK